MRVVSFATGNLIASAFRSRQRTRRETIAPPYEHDAVPVVTETTPILVTQFVASWRCISPSTGRQAHRTVVLGGLEQDVGQLGELAVEQALSRLDALDDRLAYLH